ncbi:hypothetical protein ElyMa_001557600 [Elysia marginata]|uniref:Uncharacterized protein n=1 Tax=Elysia marginata TaxID=1093978 RepID=A0AAV4JBA8_9GAST|nr:hypothetical protein ElyMa_001557600 [Elysia marginata]
MEAEGRAGRRIGDKIKDDLKRHSINKHISKFPKMESHYCSAISKHGFLAPDLSMKKMYDMYCEKQKQRNETPASKSLYKNDFSFFFYTLKKDTCGICLTKMKNPEQNEEFQEVYEEHIAEKTKVRENKEDCECELTGKENKKERLKTAEREMNNRTTSELERVNENGAITLGLPRGLSLFALSLL